MDKWPRGSRQTGAVSCSAVTYGSQNGTRCKSTEPRAAHYDGTQTYARQS